MNKLKQALKERETKLKNALALACGKKSPEYAVGLSIWNKMKSTGHSEPMVATWISTQRHYSLAIKEYENHFPSDHAIEDLEIEKVHKVFLEQGLLHECVHFVATTSEEPHEIVNNGELDEESLHDFEFLKSEYFKSLNAFQDICKEYNLDGTRQIKNRFQNARYPLPFSGHYFNPLEVTTVNLKECQKLYQERKGSIYHPVTGNDGYDPFFYIHIGYAGVGKIGVIDEESIEVSESEVAQALYDIVKLAADKSHVNLMKDAETLAKKRYTSRATL